MPGIFPSLPERPLDFLHPISQLFVALLQRCHLLLQLLHSVLLLKQGFLDRGAHESIVFLDLPVAGEAQGVLCLRAVGKLEKAGKHPPVLLGVRENRLLKVHPMRQEDVILIHAKEEEVSVALHDGVRVTGEVAEPGEVESGAGGHLQHAAPRLVAQQLDLSRIKESSRVVLRAGTGGGVPLPGQIIVSPVGIGVKSQHPRVNDDGSQLGSAALAQRPPLGRQLAAPPAPAPAPSPSASPSSSSGPAGGGIAGGSEPGGGVGARPAPLRDRHRDWGVGMGMGEKRGRGQPGDVIGGCRGRRDGVEAKGGKGKGAARKLK